MSEQAARNNFQVKILTISDSVMRGERQDESGPAVAKALQDAGFEVIEHSTVVDGVASVAGGLTRLASAFTGLLVTTGGTGFAPRDMTPEGTAEILDRRAPGLAEAMYRSGPLAPLSRGIAGTRGHVLIVNLPGSTKGALECLASIIGLLPHALGLMAGEKPH